MNEIVELKNLKVIRIVQKDCPEYKELIGKYSQAVIFDNVVSLVNLIKQNDKDLINCLENLLLSNNSQCIDDKIINIKRALFNLVNSHDLFLDNYKSIIKNDIKSKKYNFEYLTNYYYENYVGYKIFSNMRNYVQHKKMINFEIEFRDKYFELYIDKMELQDDKIVIKKMGSEINSPFELKLSILIDSWHKSIENFLFFCLYDLFEKYKGNIENYYSFLSNINTINNDNELYFFSSANRYRPLPKSSILQNRLMNKNSKNAKRYKELKIIIENEKKEKTTKYLDQLPEIKGKLKEFTDNTFNIEYLRRFLEDS